MLSENSFNLILSKREHSWDLEWLDPGSKSVLISSSVISVLLGLKLSEEHESISGNTEISTTSGLSMIELNLLLRLGESNVDIGIESVVKSSEVDKRELIRSGLLSNLGASKLGTWWSGLLEDP